MTWHHYCYTINHALSHSCILLGIFEHLQPSPKSTFSASTDERSPSHAPGRRFAPDLGKNSPGDFRRNPAQREAPGASDAIFYMHKPHMSVSFSSLFHPFPPRPMHVNAKKNLVLPWFPPPCFLAPAARASSLPARRPDGSTRSASSPPPRRQQQQA